MSEKNSYFGLEQCEKTTRQMQELCKEILADGFRVHTLPNLPEEESHRKVCGFGPGYRINCKNIVLNTEVPIPKVFVQYRFRAYFSAINLEANDLSTDATRRVGYYRVI